MNEGDDGGQTVTFASVCNQRVLPMYVFSPSVVVLHTVEMYTVAVLYCSSAVFQKVQKVQTVSIFSYFNSRNWSETVGKKGDSYSFIAVEVGGFLSRSCRREFLQSHERRNW